MSKPSLKLNLKYEYHDSHLEDFELGPGHELIITASLFPPYYSGNSIFQSIHFSCIKNYDEVAAFFEKHFNRDRGGERVVGIIGLYCPGKGVVGIDFECLPPLEIRCAKYREI